MFGDKIKRTIQRIQGEEYSSIAARITAKRMAWLDRTLPTVKLVRNLTPRDVFELLFFEHMGLEREALPVVSESDQEITWLSTNPCALLAACQELGLDTRRACRSINEKATQAFVSRINPELRFHRSYEKIRPYTDYCEERIIRVDFAANMRLAIQQAKVAQAEGLPPRGAVVTFADQILGQGHDLAITGLAQNLHAVESVLRQAAETWGDQDLCGGVLFSTCEPCPRCTTLAIQANITTLVFGVPLASIADQGRIAGPVTGRQLIEQSSAVIEVISGVQAEACQALCE